MALVILLVHLHVLLLCMLNVKWYHGWDILDCSWKQHFMYRSISPILVLSWVESEIWCCGLSIIGLLQQKILIVWCWRAVEFLIELAQDSIARWRCGYTTQWMKSVLVLVQCSLATETVYAHQKDSCLWVYLSLPTFFCMYALGIHMAASPCGFADGGPNWRTARTIRSCIWAL